MSWGEANPREGMGHSLREAWSEGRAAAGRDAGPWRGQGGIQAARMGEACCSGHAAWLCWLTAEHMGTMTGM